VTKLDAANSLSQDQILITPFVKSKFLKEYPGGYRIKKMYERFSVNCSYQENIKGLYGE
jgi:hypothetical protein